MRRVLVKKNREEKVDDLGMELFRMPKLALKLLGFWPETELTPLRILHGLVSVSTLSFGVLSEFMYGVTHLDNLIVALDAIAPPLTKGVTVLKLITMWISREKFRDVIRRVDELLKAGGNKGKFQILTNMKRTIELFGVTVLVLGNATNAAFFFRPIGNNVLNHINGRNLTRELPFIAWNPIDTSSSRIAYLFAYMLNSSFGLITAFALGAIDGMFVQFFLYISTLFLICQEDIKEAFSYKSSKRGPISPAQIKFTQRRLAAFVSKHNAVMQLSAEIVDLFTIIILGHFLSSAIIICISCVDFILGSDFAIVVYFVNSTLVVVELFIYCNGGSKVVESSTEICQVVYFQKWYEYDIKTQKMLVLIMMKAQKGTGIQVPFFAPSIPVFALMLRTAGSYITLLKTFL